MTQIDQHSGEPELSRRTTVGRPDSIPKLAIILLMLAYMFNMLDRQILTILAEPIKQDLQLADWQIGAISGLAFALLYTIAGIPLSRIADSGNRVRMISIAIAVWSAFTVTCGLARNFTDMLLARIGVGVGEAGCTPAAHSLITDYVPREKRASALAFYQLGTPLGALAGLVLGGIVLSVLDWRWAFFLAGAPGIVLAIILFLALKEPRNLTDTRDTSATSPGWKEAILTLMSKKGFWCICLASACVGFVYFGQSAFLGSLYFRTHGEALADFATQAGMPPSAFLGIALGVIIGVCGGVGTLLGGRLADQMTNQGVAGYLTVAAASTAIAAPMYVAAPLAPNMALSLTLIGFAMFSQSMSYAPTYAAIQTIAPPQMRGMAVAIQILFVNGIGLAFGPLIVGLMSDLLGAISGATWSLRISMALATTPAVLAAILFVLGRRFIKGDHSD